MAIREQMASIFEMLIMENNKKPKSLFSIS